MSNNEAPLSSQEEILFNHMKSVKYEAWGHKAVMLWCMDGEWRAALRNNKLMDGKEGSDKNNFHAATAYDALFKLYEYCLLRGFVDPLPQPSPQSQGGAETDMTAREFFDGELSAYTLSFLNEDEKETLLEGIELYAKGKVHQFKLASQGGIRWVKVDYKDQSTLPENESEVICYGYKIPSPRYNEIFVAVYDGGKFITTTTDDYNNNPDHFLISHWMPLPEPPKSN